MSEHLLSATSATTWREAPAPSRLPDALDVPRGGGPRRRMASFLGRHRFRTDTARAAYVEARAPRSGFPVATSSQALGFLGSLLEGRRALLVWAIALNVAAAGAGLVAPFLLGGLLDSVTDGLLNRTGLTTTVGIIAGLVVAQALLTFAARRASAVLGYDLLAAAREEIVRIVLRLPLGHVESSGSGDLLTRITSDVSKMATAARWAFPNLIVSVVLIGATLVAMLINSWVLTLPMLGTALVMWLGGRFYLARATAGYITESRSYSVINSTTTETVEGSRTVEAMGLGELRIAQIDKDTEVSAQAERYTMTLRNMLFAMVDSSFQLPLVGVVLLGVWGHAEGWALYAERLMGELGYLDDPAYELGMLRAQAMRAVRVVVDIGMHLELSIPERERYHGGETWTPELALPFVIERSWFPEDFMRSEVDRYLGMPAQAISYKVGERVWLGARDAAKAHAGAAFDLKEFHRHALDLGPMGLAQLQRELTPGA